MEESNDLLVFARIKTIEEYSDLSVRLLDAFPDVRIFALYGAMGVGKTTLIKFLCKQLGVAGIVNSPTYSLVNEYETMTHEVIYHFDFYRIKKIEEVYDLGYEEYFYSGQYCFIEWPEKLEYLLPPDCKKIFMEDQGGERIIKV